MPRLNFSSREQDGTVWHWDKLCVVSKHRYQTIFCSRSTWELFDLASHLGVMWKRLTNDWLIIINDWRLRLCVASVLNTSSYEGSYSGRLFCLGCCGREDHIPSEKEPIMWWYTHAALHHTVQIHFRRGLDTLLTCLGFSLSSMDTAVILKAEVYTSFVSSYINSCCGQSLHFGLSHAVLWLPPSWRTWRSFSLKPPGAGHNRLFWQQCLHASNFSRKRPGTPLIILQPVLPFNLFTLRWFLLMAVM